MGSFNKQKQDGPNELNTFGSYGSFRCHFATVAAEISICHVTVSQ